MSGPVVRLLFLQPHRASTYTGPGGYEPLGLGSARLAVLDKDFITSLILLFLILIYSCCCLLYRQSSPSHRHPIMFPRIELPRERVSKKPSSYPTLAFHLLRLGQLLSSIIVSSVLIFFVHHLHKEEYYIPWTFILVRDIPSLTPPLNESQASY